MKRTAITFTLLAVAALLATPAMAFNVRNDTSVIICAQGPDNYFEAVMPHSTSKGWYYTKHSTLTLYVASQNYYVCVGDNYNVCSWKCNTDTVTATIPAHAQLVISKAICDISSKEWCPGGGQCINACDVVNYPLRFEYWVN